MLDSGAQFNLLLTDVMMPDVDGPTLLHYVRNNSAYQELPVVMMSSNEHADVVLNCIRLGAEDYLLKPVTKKAVKHMWAHVWRRKQRTLQMVPRFENGREVVEEDEFDQQMAAGNLVVDHGDVDMVLPVPDTEQYSSDGDSDGGEDARANSAEMAYFASAYARGLDADAVDANPNANRRRGGESSSGAHGGDGAATATAKCPFAAGVRADAGKPMEKVEEGDAEGEEPDFFVDPLRVEDPAAPCRGRRLGPAAPIAGLAGGKATVREWIESARRDGRRIDRRDALHVLGQTAELLARQHDAGMLLGAARPSNLTVSPQGDVTIARPSTPPRATERAELAAREEQKRRLTQREFRGGTSRRARRGDSDDDVDDDDDYAMDDDDSDAEEESRRRRLAAAAASRIFASSATAYASMPTSDRAEAARAAARREALYASPEERAGTAPSCAAAECFALGVMMVEMCWPEVAEEARGDVGRLLSATLRPDGAGAAALAADPRESAIARRLLQPMPENRPTAAETVRLLSAAAEAAAEEAAASSTAAETPGEGWGTPRERGLATERRRAELIALAGFLRASRDARQREVQAHRVRSALLAHALRQLGGVSPAAAENSPGGGPLGGGPLGGQLASASPSASPAAGRLGTAAATTARRGASFDLGRRATAAPAAFTPGPAPLGEKPSKRVRRTSLETADGDVGGAGAGAGASPRGSLDLGAGSATPSRAPRSADGGAHGGARPPSRQTSFKRGKIGGDGGKIGGDGSLRAMAAATAAGDTSALGLGGRSLSTGDLTLLDRSNAAAAAAAAAGHHPASELNEGALNALEETFFDSCARAIAPVARAYAQATSAAAIESVGADASADASADSGADMGADGGKGLATADARRALAETRRREAASEAASAAGAALGGALVSFGADLAQCMRKTTLRVRADVSHGDVHSFGEMVCGVGWDRDGEYIATVGVSRRVRVFEVAATTDLGAAVQCPVAEMQTACKLSAVAWNPYIKSTIASADYDGGVHVWDVNRARLAAEMHKHKKRVWSLHFSAVDPTRLVSGGDDGAVRVWSLSQRDAAAKIQTRANVCSVQFSPENANVVAVASADCGAYVYDVRHASRPLVTLSGHRRAASYVRWMGGDKIVTASTDNTLKLWDVKRGMTLNLNPNTSATPRDACVRTFAGHVNAKNFVGLDVAADGHVACGSEDNTVCLYARCVPTPIAKQSLAVTAAGVSGGEAAPGEKPGLFVSSVAWSPDSRRVLAANSCGAVKILERAQCE